MIFLYIFLAIAVIKIAINTQKLCATKRFLTRYCCWLEGKDPYLVQYKVQVEKLIRGAGISDHFVSNVGPVGFGLLSTGSASVLDNFPHNREDIARATYLMFHHAIGVYRSRIIDTFNPFYWIEGVINLPKHVFAYLGISHESIFTKGFQLAWWVVATVSAVFYAIYRSETEGAIRTLIDGWLRR